jgi:type II secretion system protein D
MIVEFDERSNSVIVMGQGESFDTVERIVAALDQPAAAGAKLVVRAVRLEHADPSIVANAIVQATATPGWTWWRGTDPGAIQAEPDRRARTVVLIGREDRLAQAEGYARQLDEAAARPEQKVETLTLHFAAADGVARSLERFFTDRARAAGPGGLGEAPSFIGSPDGRVLIVSASEPQLAQIRELVGQMDMPEESEGRTREIFTLKNADAGEIARTLREQFPTSRTARVDAVIVTPQPTINAVVVSAPDALFEKVSLLVAQLDAPPSTEDTRMVTIGLEAARADEAARALESALPSGVKVTITPVRRTNSLILTGSQEAVDLVIEQIGALDEQPTRNPVEFRRLTLEHAVAYDVAVTLRQLLRDLPLEDDETRPAVSAPRNENSLLVQGTAEQLNQIEAMVQQLDLPRAETQTTEFVPLRFADAEQTARALEVFYGPYASIPTTPEAERVAVIGVPVSNSLVISADEKEWPGIRALIEKLDSEEYDTSRQLEIIALKYADATSLARALNEAFAAPLRAELERERARARTNRGGRGRDGENGGGPEAPTVLIDADDTVTVTAESLTNSLIISAGREDLERIQAVVAKVDVPDFAELPAARVIPVARGVPTELANSLREMYADLESTRGAGPRAVVIVGDDRSGTLIVRAEESEFARISALAQTLQQEADKSLARVRVLRLNNVPASYVAATLETTFAPAAKQRGEPLAIAVDRLNNSLVISSSEALYEEIGQVAAELEEVPGMPAPGEEGQQGRTMPAPGVFIIDIENNSPEEVKQLLEQMGVSQPTPDDRMGVVSKPVTIVPLRSRRALAIVGSTRDAQAITSLVRTIDAAPAFAEQHIEIVHLTTASAANVATALENLLKPMDQDAQTGPAAALAEQIRRLSIHRDGADQPDLSLDLSKPIRILAEEQTNAVVIASTEANVAALREVTKLLDKLPVGDAVTIRFFPLVHASATRIAGVVRDLFSQGEAIRRLPGSTIAALPTTQVGQALIGEIAVSVDERTNALVIAGREEAVALVEIIVDQLDSDETDNWIEPSVIPLKHADAARLARKLNEILVDGVEQTPEAEAMRRQVARIRIAQAAPEGKTPPADAPRVESDIFASLTSLTILPEENLNAIIVIGSTANASAVRELVKMLDVPAAAAANTVRVYPLKFAAADRVAGMLEQIFEQQVESGAIRKEDDLILVADARTNSLVISTSPGSFAVVEALLQRFDGEAMDPLVGIHVVPVPNGDVEALAPKIERLMRERLEAARRAGCIPSPSDTFSVQAEPATSSLIVAASDENLKIVQELISVLQAGAEQTGTSQVVDVIPAAGMRAAELVDAIQGLYVDRENTRRGQDAVSVTADERLNAVIVRGNQADIDAIRTLIGQLAEAPVTAVTEIKRIELVRANAADVVELLHNVLAGRAIAGGGSIGGRQAQILRFIKDRQAEHMRGAKGDAEPTEAEINGSIQEQVTLTAELRTNSVVAVAPAPIMRLIETLVADLDQTSAGARKVEIFELKNADARAMADVLRDLFNLTQDGETLVLVPGRSEEKEQKPDIESSQLFPIPDERQALAITIDGRTNSLLVSGTEEYLKEVRNVVTQLDSVEANEREQVVYQLRNANATMVAETLRGYFDGEAQTFRQILGSPERSGSLIRLLEREVTVQGDEASQRLIVGVSPRYRDAIDKIVAELDATPPQVMIEVLLAEVTLDDSFDWGVDFEVGPLGRLDVLGGFLTAGAGLTTALGVPNVSVSTSDFSFMVRALEAQGRLEVLSKPQIMVNNNETANIQVGENIAIIGSVNSFDNRTQANVEREDVGILLEVTPSINEDGYVRMSIMPQISNVSTRTTQISEDFQAPIISKREINTNVTVKDGETIVIGGLIQSTLEKRDTKVPLLGDIPIAGEVFRSHKYSNLKTELLVILTPRVIRSATPEGTSRLREIRDRSIEELSVPEEVKAQIVGEVTNGESGSAPTPANVPGPLPQDQPAWFGPYQPGREPEDTPQ